jgi:hypothetical protein
LALLDGFTKLFAPTVKVSPHRSDRHPQRIRNLLVAAFFLMIEDQDRPLNLTEKLKLFLHSLLELAFFYLLLGVAVGVRKPFLPRRSFVRKRNVGAVITSPPLPLILRNIHRDPVEISCDQGFAAKTRQGSVEPQKDILRKIIDMLTTAGQAQQGAEDHRLMVAYQLLEAEIDVQARLDNRVLRKFH